MTGTAPRRRAIEACRLAGLPVVDPHDCTCGMHGGLVVLARSSGGLEVLWPYDERCPIHEPRDDEQPPTAWSTLCDVPLRSDTLAAVEIADGRDLSRLWHTTRS
jgi:hypothetical protein